METLVTYAYVPNLEVFRRNATPRIAVIACEPWSWGQHVGPGRAIQRQQQSNSRRREAFGDPTYFHRAAACISKRYKVCRRKLGSHQGHSAGAL